MLDTSRVPHMLNGGDSEAQGNDCVADSLQRLGTGV